MSLLSIVYIPKLRHACSISYWQRVFCTPLAYRICSWDLYRMWENCTKENFTLGLLYAYYMVNAGIFGIFTDRLYFLEKIQTIEIITDVMQVWLQIKKLLKKLLIPYMSLVSLVKRRGAIFRFSRQSYEASNVLMRFVAINALFSTIIHILKVEDNQNGIYMYLKQTHHLLALISGKQKDAQTCESIFITTPFMKNRASVAILRCAC